MLNENKYILNIQYISDNKKNYVKVPFWCSLKWVLFSRKIVISKAKKHSIVKQGK